MKNPECLYRSIFYEEFGVVPYLFFIPTQYHPLNLPKYLPKDVRFPLLLETPKIRLSFDMDIQNTRGASKNFESKRVFILGNFMNNLLGYLLTLRKYQCINTHSFFPC